MKKLFDQKHIPYYLGGAILLAVVVAILVVSRSSQKDKDNKLIDQISQDNPGIDGFQVVTDAATIYQAFGLDASWYDPSGWTEDEDAVIAVLSRYDQSSFRILEKAYFDKHEGRHLEADIRDFFRAEQLQEIAHLI